MRVLALITDGYGGFGGIAVYNRDLLEAMCTHPRVTTVVALPRKITHDLQMMPQDLEYRSEASRGDTAFLWALAKDALRGGRPDLIYCAHVNLAPVALALRILWRAPVLCALFGIEAWQPTGRRLSDFSVGRFDRFFAISRITRSRFAKWRGLDESRIDLLPNAIHMEKYGIAPPSSEIVSRFGMEGRRVLLTLGCIVSRERAKGFDEVINVLPRIREYVPDILYVIAGDGDYRPLLEAEVTKRNLNSHVVFTGLVSEARRPTCTVPRMPT